MLLEESQGTKFHGIYFVRFGLKLGEIMNFKWFLSLKIQRNHKKLSIGRKNQLRTWPHLPNMLVTVMELLHNVQIPFPLLILSLDV
jgi:hypothetical protein